MQTYPAWSWCHIRAKAETCLEEYGFADASVQGFLTISTVCEGMPLLLTMSKGMVDEVYKVNVLFRQLIYVLIIYCTTSEINSSSRSKLNIICCPAIFPTKSSRDRFVYIVRCAARGLRLEIEE